MEQNDNPSEQKDSKQTDPNDVLEAGDDKKIKNIIEVTAEQTAKFYGKVVARDQIPHKRNDLKVDFRELTEHNVGQLRKLLNSTLPVNYHNDFYYRLTSYQRYSKLAYFKDILIGAITCKDDHLKVGDIEEPQHGAYIMTITVFDKYRRYGIASKLLQEAMKECCEDREVNYIFLDVQENNESALEFYKKHGFAVSHLREDYYTNIEPANSYFLYKEIRSPKDAVVSSSESKTEESGK